MNLSDYTQQQLTEVGDFRGFPIAWKLDEKKSGSVALLIKYSITARWHGSEEGWSQPWGPGYFVTQRAWIVGRTDKGGGLNDTTIAALGKAGVWNGDWDAIDGPVPSIFVLLNVQANESENGKTYYEARWANPDAEVPPERGGFAPTDPDLLATMRTRFQGAARAVAGGVPSGTAPAPPSPTPAGQPQAAPAPATTGHVQQTQQVPQQVPQQQPLQQQQHQQPPEIAQQQQAAPAPVGPPQQVQPPQPMQPPQVPPQQSQTIQTPPQVGPPQIAPPQEVGPPQVGPPTNAAGELEGDDCPF